MKKVKVAICASLFFLAVGCSNEDFIEDTEPLIDTIEQQKGTVSNGNGGYQGHVCYESNNGGTPPPCKNNGSGSSN